MVRTKADSCPAAGRKVVAARAPRKGLGGSSSGAANSSSSAGASPSGSKYAGGNPVCPRPTPDWQKGIDSFFSKKPGQENEESDSGEVGCSGSSSECGGSQPGGSGSSSSCAGSSGDGTKEDGLSVSQVVTEMSDGDEDDS